MSCTTKMMNGRAPDTHKLLSHLSPPASSCTFPVAQSLFILRLLAAGFQCYSAKAVQRDHQPTFTTLIEDITSFRNDLSHSNHDHVEHFTTMLINCFRGADSKPVGAIDDHRPQAPRPATLSATPRKSSRFIKRQGSDESRLSSTSTNSTISNESISKLPPCKRGSDPKIEAMMMPLPQDHRPSKCLRLSHPRTYGNLVSDMKRSKGCRDWKNFAVFPTDDVDMSITADEAARQRAIDYQRKVKQLNSSFQWSEGSNRSIEVDMIG
ncbi:uncharacterized protein LTR77_004589 [Saxophila tyrrhenica]|uniref:Uncharacterized protein n=1 Tax=Saxophila tyrrhenica TaxID=1690608 RepID=A0AAV9PGF8_9PEZI|nr:hypothetical protein LTR77_004589 [Saxophila tyrrhenica]